MPLYLGSQGERDIIINNIIYQVNFFSKTPITNGVRLLLLDNSILKDSNGLYITVKKEDE